MHSSTAKLISRLTFAAVLVAMAGCWNGDVSNVSLGDISVGQQLLDLQSAHEADAINDEEYEQARHKLLSLLDGCDCESDGSNQGDSDNQSDG